MGGLLSQLVAEAALSPDASFKVYGAKLKGKDEREYMRLLLEKLPLMKWVSVEKSGIKSVPEAVNLFKELRGLVLPHNLIKSLPSLSLSSLTHLNLSFNALSVFPEPILKLERLEYLDVSHNAVSLFPSSASFAPLKSLRTLILSFNPLNAFPIPILELKRLKELELSQCGLTWLPNQPSPPSSSLSTTPEWPLLFRKNLIKLDVSNNVLGSLAGLDALVHLEFLHAASTQLDTFPDLASLVKLSHLDLSHNRIVQLPLFLSKLERLQTLKLNDNRILEVPKHIKSLSMLRELYLHENLIHRISKGLAACKKLYKLTLEYNNLTRLPVELRLLNSLSVLTLHYNKFKLLPEPFYHMEFIQHLFFLTLEGNALSSEFARGIEEMGSRMYLLTREISQSKETDAAAKRSSRPRPTMQRLASQYGTLRGPPGSSSSSSPFPAFPPPSSAPVQTAPSPEQSGNASLEVPGSNKARRFSSPGRRNFGTGSLTPSAARSAAASAQEALQTPTTSLGIAQPQAAFMGSPASGSNTGSLREPSSRGQMPAANKFKDAFDQLLRDVDFSTARREELSSCSPEEKWNLLRIYKGPLLELLSNNVEKLNRDRKFEEWQKRDKKLKALADAHASAEVFVSSLRQRTLTMSEMNSLRLLLDVAPLPWIYEFLDSGGLLSTIKYLEGLVFRENKSAQDIVCESGAISVLAYFLKNDKIASLVLTSPDAVKTITVCLNASEPLTRRGALELLYDLSKIHSFAPRLILSALESMEPERPTSVLVNILKAPHGATASVRDHAMCLAVLNRLLESQVDIIERYRSRSQMSKLGVESALEQLNQLPDSLLQTELSKWDTSAASDEEEIKRLAAQDYRVLARLQGDTTVPAVEPASSNSLAAPDDKSAKPHRAFKFSEKRARSLSMGPLSLAFPSTAPTPRTGSASSEPGAAAPMTTARRAIRVLVSDIGSLSLLFSDTMTAADVVSKILARHELKPDKFGLFFVGTDSNTGQVEGYWIKDMSVKITQLVESKVDAVLSYKTLPWKIAVECLVHKCTLNVEAEPSWTVGQATAHIVTSNSAVLSLDNEYDLFAGGTKLDESLLLANYEAALFAEGVEARAQLFPRPEPQRIFFSHDLAPVTIDVDPRMSCGDLVAAALAKTSSTPTDSVDDFALCLESKSKGNKRNSNSSAREDQGASNSEKSARRLWLSNAQPFWASHYDKRRHKLLISLRPREIFVSFSEADSPRTGSVPDSTPSSTGSSFPADVTKPANPTSPNEIVSQSTPLNESIHSDSPAVGEIEPTTAVEPDSATSDATPPTSQPEIVSHHPIENFPLDLSDSFAHSRAGSSSSLFGIDNEESDTETEKVGELSAGSKVRIELSFDETVSSLIKLAVKYLRDTKNQSVNFTLFKGDKLLNRQKTLKEVGVVPGDHLVLRSVFAAESDPVAAPSSSPSASGSVEDATDDVDIHAEPLLETEKSAIFEGSGHSTQALAAASLNQLILRLTDPVEYDKAFMETFLLTYRSFTSPDQVLTKIIQRYRAPADKVGADKVDTVRVRCLVFMTNWLDKSFQDLGDRALERMNIWIESEVEPERRPVLLKTLNRVRERQSEVEMLPAISIKYKTPQPPRLIDLEPEEIARQLTLDTSLIYSKVKPVEFFDCAWAKPKLQHLAPNVLALIDRFNFYAQWVVSEIVSERRLKARKQVFTKFIRVAAHLREIGNFHVMYSIVTAFSNSSVSRLKWTLEKLSKTSKQILQDLETLMAMEGSFRNYREALQQIASSPCIPYVGVPLKDLTFIEDGNPNLVNGLINWAKRKLVFDVVGDFLRHQIVIYRINPIAIGDSPFDQILRELPNLDEAEQFRLSLEVEPRGSKLEQLVQ
eukprot:TRINITY_DN4269_c0_g1_i1.p1 TRINITY_DN4269_c0_g1~~TRINITY_DN4269_c0_g1_i1.p1  ORF type:complete len:1857 (-),score=321.81 TRINITY_DN4269_c0_g1_i1:1141-6711(-)